VYGILPMGILFSMVRPTLTKYLLKQFVIFVGSVNVSPSELRADTADFFFALMLTRDLMPFQIEEDFFAFFSK